MTWISRQIIYSKINNDHISSFALVLIIAIHHNHRSWCIGDNTGMQMYRPLKKRRKSTFDVERISDTHYAAKAKVDLTPFRVKKGHYEFPIEEKDILRRAEELGMDILLPPIMRANATIHRLYPIQILTPDYTRINWKEYKRRLRGEER